jgi:DNA-binding NarL/FixJ family response regulator
MNTPIRILVADDHPVVRDGLVAVLGTQADFEVVGEAANGAEAVERARRLRPDVVLIDLQMPKLDGVAAIEQLRADDRTIGVVVFTAFDSDERIVSALRAGAQGYLLKGAPRDEIFRAIRVVHAGGSLLEPLVASRVINQLQPTAAAERLTKREREVLILLAQGRSNKQIAAVLDVTERTAKFHVGAIMRKLDATNRTEAVALAAQQGLITLPHA